jgi:hypothetical protein
VTYTLRPAAPDDLEPMMRIGHEGIRPWVEALRRGVGSAIVRDVLARGRAARMPVRLRVLRTNPARRVYERLGFAVTRESATHVEMEAP